MSSTPQQIVATGRSVRAWVGTGFDIRPWKEWFANVLAAKCVWAIAQVEVCPTTGNHHLQYAMYFKNDHDLKWMKKHIHPTDWFHEMNGAPADSLRYCTDPTKRREGTPDEVGPWQVGEMPRQGNRRDLESTAFAVMEGSHLNYSHFVRDRPDLAVRYGRGISDLFSCRPPPERVSTKCFYFYGEAGIGKSTGWRRAGIPPSSYFSPCLEKSSNSFNFSGYGQEDLVVVDEVNECNQSRYWWLRFADEVPVKLCVKMGPPVYFNSKVIVTTSNTPPPGHLRDDPAWCRRWTVVEMLTRADAESAWRMVAGLILPRDFCGSGTSAATVPVHVPVTSDPRTVVDVLMANARRPPARDDGVEVSISGTG